MPSPSESDGGLSQVGDSADSRPASSLKLIRHPSTLQPSGSESGSASDLSIPGDHIPLLPREDGEWAIAEIVASLSDTARERRVSRKTHNLLTLFGSNPTLKLSTAVASKKMIKSSTAFHFKDNEYAVGISGLDEIRSEDEEEDGRRWRFTLDTMRCQLKHSELVTDPFTITTDGRKLEARFRIWPHLGSGFNWSNADPDAWKGYVLFVSSGGDPHSLRLRLKDIRPDRETSNRTALGRDFKTSRDEYGTEEVEMGAIGEALVSRSKVLLGTAGADVMWGYDEDAACYPMSGRHKVYQKLCLHPEREVEETREVRQRRARRRRPAKKGSAVSRFIRSILG